MSTIPKRVTAKGEMPAPGARDHEHVGRISTQTTIPGLVAIHYAAGIGAIIAYALYATALRISIDQLFGPLALGAAARLHLVLVIFCFLSGAFLFGVVGVIMAVPVALIVKTTLALLYGEPGKDALASE